MPISLKNPLRYTAADHSVLCVCTSLLSPSRSITFVHSTISLLGQHSDCQALSQVQRSLIHTLSLSLPFCQCDLSSPTQVYRMRIILSWYQNFCLFSFVLHTHTHTHSLTPFNTPPSAPAAAYKFLLFLLSSAVCAHDASSRRRCLLAHVLRLLCVCVFAVVVVASSSWLLRRRRRRARVVVVCKVVCVQISTLFEGRPLPILLLRSLSLSLAVCVFSHSFALSLSLACFACSLLFDFSCRLASWVRVDVLAKNKWCALVEAEQHVWNE